MTDKCKCSVFTKPSYLSRNVAWTQSPLTCSDSSCSGATPFTRTPSRSVFDVRMIQIWTFPAAPSTKRVPSLTERVDYLRYSINLRLFNWRVPALLVMHKSAGMVPPPAASQPGRSLYTLNFSLSTLFTMKLIMLLCLQV